MASWGSSDVCRENPRREAWARRCYPVSGPWSRSPRATVDVNVAAALEDST